MIKSYDKIIIKNLGNHLPGAIGGSEKLFKNYSL